MNTAALMKIMAAKEQFNRNHPKFSAFVKTAFSRGLEEGSIIEISVKKPDGEELQTNLKLQQSDLELLQGLQEMLK